MWNDQLDHSNVIIKSSIMTYITLDKSYRWKTSKSQDYHTGWNNLMLKISHQGKKLLIKINKCWWKLIQLENNEFIQAENEWSKTFK